MSLRDTARIAALETRVSELTARLERLEESFRARERDRASRPTETQKLRKGRS